MDDMLLAAAPVIGVVIGMAIHKRRQAKQGESMRTKVRELLTQHQSLTLPELVTGVGLKDGFLSHGKLINVLNPLVAVGELVQSEPEGTTMKNRLERLRFSLRV